MWQVQKGEGRGGEEKHKKEKGEEYFPHYPPPPPWFSPLLKPTIPFDACHMLKRSPSKSVYNHHYVITKYAKHTKCNKHRKSHIKDATAKDILFK